MKRLVAELLTLTTSIKGEELMVYLSITDEAASAVLLDERSVSQMSIPQGSRSKLCPDREVGVSIGLRIAMELQVEDIHAFMDSKLVASQVEGSYEAIDEKMKDIRKRCWN
uniref:Reverse transcriptase domain-containing protein n=1 Tax=Tanacetum cinerariifolium TaxID=118510 RepID=A0A6L2JNK2_TANCI|nr:hypothetical protein [Tanacetum cinerariifolium]